MENNLIINNALFIGLVLAIVDIISMGITKKTVLGQLNNNWLIVAVVLYGCQMLIFYYGLTTSSMTTLNLTWNLFSNIVITIIGIWYFNENITSLEQYGILFGLFSLFLFSISEFTK